MLCFFHIKLQKINIKPLLEQLLLLVCFTEIQENVLLQEFSTYAKCVVFLQKLLKKFFFLNRLGCRDLKKIITNE